MSSGAHRGRIETAIEEIDAAALHIAAGCPEAALDALARAREDLDAVRAVLEVSEAGELIRQIGDMVRGPGGTH